MAARLLDEERSGGARECSAPKRSIRRCHKMELGSFSRRGAPTGAGAQARLPRAAPSVLDASQAPLAALTASLEAAAPIAASRRRPGALRTKRSWLAATRPLGAGPLAVAPEAGKAAFYSRSGNTTCAVQGQLRSGHFSCSIPAAARPPPRSRAPAPFSRIRCSGRPAAGGLGAAGSRTQPGRCQCIGACCTPAAAAAPMEAAEACPGAPQSDRSCATILAPASPHCSRDEWSANRLQGMPGQGMKEDYIKERVAIIWLRKQAAGLRRRRVIGWRC